VNQPIFIEINRTCDKDCHYCYNKRKTSIPTRPDINRILLSVIKLSGEKRNIRLVFSGGEPTKNLNDITLLIEKLRTRRYRPKITIITNVDNISEEFKRFIRVYNPSIVLSFNDASIENIKTIRRIKTRAQIFVRFTLSPNNINSIARYIIILLQQKIQIGLSPAYGIDWDTKSLNKLSDIYFFLLNHQNYNLIYDFDNPPERRICESLSQPNAIDINGDIHPCHRAIYLKRDIQKSKFVEQCFGCPAYQYCIPCIYKDIPGEGCKIRVAISPAYKILYEWRKKAMKKKVKITYKGKKYEIPQAVIKQYIKDKKNSGSSKKNNRNFYELGESDCY